MDLTFLKEFGPLGGFTALFIMAVVVLYRDGREKDKIIAQKEKEKSEIEEKRVSEAQNVTNKVVLVLEEVSDDLRHLNIALLTRDAKENNHVSIQQSV